MSVKVYGRDVIMNYIVTAYHGILYYIGDNSSASINIS